jgi:hypothetical protein
LLERTNTNNTAKARLMKYAASTRPTVADAGADGTAAEREPTADQAAHEFEALGW